jgi:hypothetical protein
MQSSETRTGLSRFLPFLRERNPIPSDYTPEQIKARRLTRNQDSEPSYEVEKELVIPKYLYSEDRIARVWVLTQGSGERWRTIVTNYDTDSKYDYDHSNEKPILGIATFKASSLQEALSKESKWIEDSTEMYGWTDMNNGLSEEIKDSYSQRMYRLIKD